MIFAFASLFINQYIWEVDNDKKIFRIAFFCIVDYKTFIIKDNLKNATFRVAYI